MEFLAFTVLNAALEFVRVAVVSYRFLRQRMSGKAGRQGVHIRNIPAMIEENLSEVRRDIGMLHARICVLHQQSESRDSAALGVPVQNRSFEIESELRVIERVIFPSLKSAAIVIGLVLVASFGFVYLSHLHKKWDQ